MTAFETGGALNPEQHRDIIVQRPELDRILSHIRNEDLYIALCSPRQTGKTTLLYQVQMRLHAHGYGVAYLDLSGLNDLSKAKFYRKICTDIHEGFEGLLDTTAEAPLNPQDVTDQIAFSSYLIWLSAHTPRVRKLIFLLDEVGGVPEALSSTLFPSLRSFFHRGRRQSKERDLYRKVMFIFAGALDLQRLMQVQGRNSPLRNICEPLSLDDLEREQSHRLASNLEGFPRENREAIAEAVHWWCDGHPYLTQRLYALIDKNQEYRKTSVEQISRAVDQLVEVHLLYGEDANLAHIINCLRHSKEYCDPVFNALAKEPRKSFILAEELLAVGIIKRSHDLRLSIRNRIYEQVLKNFFEEEEPEGRS